MVYTEADFQVDPPEPGREILIARLAAIGFESFEETESGVKAYIRTDAFGSREKDALAKLQVAGCELTSTLREIKEENWNQLWESSYEPVSIAGRIYIRASFHPEQPEFEHSILIDPKMSFGTAHHETTAQMMEAMLAEELAGKVVLDMGCGTGVLAILAEQRGASRVTAIDNDAQATENARENVQKNNCIRTDVVVGGAEAISGCFDVILANINKNILVQDMKNYASHLRAGGVILFSGFYREDLEELRESAQKEGLVYSGSADKNGWVVARFTKK